MIKKVNIHAFQCWEEQTLDFHNGVNIIAGTSDNGKSALLRAIIWCLTNRPLGKSFVTNGCKEGECAVEIEFDDCVVERQLGKDGGYTLDGEKYKAVGKQVPDDVASAMNIQPVNIQQQHDPPFLLSESSAEVARRLNEVADLQLIDLSLSNAKKAVTNTTKAIERTESNAAKYRVDLEEYEDLDELLEELEELEELDKKRKKVSQGVAVLKDSVSKYQDAHKRIKEIGSIPDLSKAEKLQKKIDDVSSTADELEELIEAVEKQHRICKDRKQELAELKEQMPDICPECGQEITKGVSQ